MDTGFQRYDRYWVSEVWVLGYGGMGPEFRKYVDWILEVWVLGFGGMDSGFWKYHPVAGYRYQDLYYPDIIHTNTNTVT